VITPSLAEGGVVVQVDEPGQHRLPGGVDHLGVGGLACEPGRHLVGGADVGDPVAVQHDRAAEMDVAGVVHRDDRAVLDQDSACHGCSYRTGG